MPSWVRNRVGIEGPQEAVEEFLGFAGESTPLLQHLPPPPEDELPLIVNDHLNSNEGAQEVGRPSDSAALPLVVRGIERALDAHSRQNQIRAWSPHYGATLPAGVSRNPFSMEVKSGRFKASPAMEENIARFGVPDGESWRRLTWGSTQSEIDLQVKRSVLVFRSAWSSLEKGYVHLSLMFPTLLFRYVWLSEELAEKRIYVGYSVFQNGTPRAANEEAAKRGSLVKNYKAKHEANVAEASLEMEAALQRLEEHWWDLAKSV